MERDPINRVADDAVEVERVLTWFDTTTEFLIGTEVLQGIAIEELRRLFAVSPDDETDALMYHCYPVREQHCTRLQRCVSTTIDLTQFDYFVEANAIAPLTSSDVVEMER